MFKRLIYVICYLALLSVVLSGCGSSTETAETQKFISDCSFFETMDSAEYLKLLNELDSSPTQEIVAISNSTYGRKFTGPFNMYTVTYKVCEVPKDTTVQYEY